LAARTVEELDMTKPPRNDMSAKLDARVYRYARTLAAWEGIRMAEFLSLAVAEVVEKKWKEAHGEKLDLVKQLKAEMEGGGE
jgi:hypothetical protein